MSSISPNPTAWAQRFAFDGSEALYRDVRGLRVIADVEGRGEFLVAVNESELVLLVDGEASDARSGRFAKSLTVAALGAGRVTVEVRSGEPPHGKARTGVGLLKGCGFVMASRSPVRVDGMHEFATPSEFLRVPFFQSVESNEPFKVVRFDDWTCKLIDAFDIADSAALTARGWAVQNISKVESLLGKFSDSTEMEGPIASHLNAASWNCPVPGGCGGLILRKTYDRFHGRQRARVLVDGTPLGWWYLPIENRVSRWAEAEFGIQQSFVEGKSSVVLTVDPVAGSPLWSVGKIEVLALVQ